MNIVDRIISPNIWNGTFSATNKYLNNNGKEESQDATNFNITNYIRVKPNSDYYVSRISGSVAYLCFYDINKVFISGVNWGDISSTKIITTPTNCYYIRNSITTAQSQKLIINESNPSINGKYFPYVMYKRYDIVDLILPSNEYQRVEYIESVGTQWINTGVIPNNTTKCVLDYRNLKNIGQEYQTPIGQQTNSGGYGYSFYIGSQNNVAWRGGYAGTAHNTNYIVAYGERNVYSLKHKEFKINDTTYTFDEPNFDYNSVSLSLFGKKDSYGLIESYSVGQLYSCKIYDNNTLVRNFIPCYRKADNVIGLYDTVNNQFYTNQGTGTFLKGANVNNYKRLKIGG